MPAKSESLSRGADRHKRYLVHDEVESFTRNKGSETHKFRLRIWRGQRCDPVVLVSQVKGGIPPHWMVNRVSNYVLQALLGFGADEMIYMEDEQHEGYRALSHVAFEVFGHEHRLRLFRPHPTHCLWSDLEAIIGEKIER